MIGKKVENQRKSQNLIRHDKVNRLKQLGFTTSWNINDQKKDYDALEDPHADKYFRYQSVKIHIKELRKSIAKSQKNDGEKKKISRLIKQKLVDHLPAIKAAAQTYNILNTDLSKLQVTQKVINQNPLAEIEKSLKKHKKRKNKHLNHNLTDAALNFEVKMKNEQQNDQKPQQESPIQQKVRTQNKTSDEAYRLTKQQQVENQRNKKGSTKKKQQALNCLKHEDFIAFIAKKREKIESVNKTNE